MSQSEKIATLTAEYEAALARSRTEKTPESRRAVVEASAALSAALPRQKPNGFGSRVGQRQQAARRAEQAERNARAADRRWR